MKSRPFVSAASERKGARATRVAPDRARSRSLQDAKSSIVQVAAATSANARVGRRFAALLVTALLGAFTVGAVTDAAGAVGSGHAQSTVVNAVPFKSTPNITNGIVYGIDQVGSQIIVGGSFTGVQNAGSTTTLTRNHVLSFDATSGALSTTFAPSLDGTVEAVAPGPVANTVYAGGFFSTVNGVKSKSIALIDTQTGKLVSSWKPPALNGAVYSIGSANGHLLITGTFTLAGSSTRNGLASLNPTTGALDAYLTVALTGHHNYNGSSGANGGVGGRALAINPTGSQMTVIGNFKNADGTLHDQIARVTLGTSSAALDTGWNTTQFTAACYSNAFDTYVTDVQYAPDGSYLVVTATGGNGTNSDGTRSLCDSASRWPSSASGTNAMPTWVDYTGNDTLWSVAVTGTAIYVGGHQRWLNNSNGSDYAGAGAVPRPGLAALDPISGMPLAWNPGRNTRGAGAYALFVNANGLYVGSDTDYIGNYYYKHQKIAYFPLAGGTAPASTGTTALPADIWAAAGTAPDSGVTAGGLSYRASDGTRFGPSTASSDTSINWANTRGAFMVGPSLFYGLTDGSFNRAAFTASGAGASSAVDPYDDPKWDSVQTGSGQTYQGVKSPYYAEIPSVTGAFYSAGKLYYTLSGRTALYSRWFSPDSGTVGSAEFTSTAVDFSHVQGMFLSGSSLYWASSVDGSLHRLGFADGAADPTTDTVVSSPATDGHNWRASSLFLFGPATFPNAAPTASATSSCTSLTCTFDGSQSRDSDGSVSSYAWTFGDGSTGTGVAPTHGYAHAGTYTVSLVVTDNGGAQSAVWIGSVTVTAPANAVAFRDSAGFNSVSANPSVVVPSSVQQGDLELLYVSAGTDGQTVAPNGWSLVASRDNTPLETDVYSRVAPAGDAGSKVSLMMRSAVRVDVTLAVYSGAQVDTTASAAETNTTKHEAPAIGVNNAASYVVSYWTSRNSTSSTWTPPSAVTVRHTGTGTGGGHVDTELGDSGPVATGTYPSQIADSGTVAGKGTSFSVVLSPAS